MADTRYDQITPGVLQRLLSGAKATLLQQPRPLVQTTDLAPMPRADLQRLPDTPPSGSSPAGQDLSRLWAPFAGPASPQQPATLDTEGLSLGDLLSGGVPGSGAQGMMAKGIDTLLRRAGVDMEPPPYKLDPAKRAKLVAKLKTGTYRTQAEAEALADELAKDPVLVAAMHDKNTKTPSSMLQERYNAAYDRTLSPPAKSALDVWHAIQAGDSDIVLGGQHFNPSEKGLCAQVVHKILAASGYPTETGDARETEGWLKANAEKVSGAGMLPGDIVAMNDRGNAHGHIGVYVGGGKVFHEYNPSGGIVVEPLSPLWKTVSGVYRVPPPGGTADTGQQDYAGAFEPPGPPITTPGSPSPQPQQQEPPSAPSGGGGWKINWDD